MIQILLADDNEFVRTALVELFDSTGDITVVAECEAGQGIVYEADYLPEQHFWATAASARPAHRAQLQSPPFFTAPSWAPRNLRGRRELSCRRLAIRPVRHGRLDGADGAPALLRRHR